MLYNYGKEEWISIINQSYDMEFDYIAIDKIGQIAVFSTFNRGYTPDCVTSSFDKFSALDINIQQLPIISETIFIKKDGNENNYSDWKKYSSLGFYAYDNDDVHRTKKSLQYDIIYSPKSPLKIDLKSTIYNFIDIIPFFDLIFGEDIKFEKLEKSLQLKTKPDKL